MKYLIPLLLLPGVNGIIQAQTITIRDQDSGEPIELVTLLSTDPRAYASTDEHGQADIYDFKDAARIEIRMLGFRTVVKSYEELSSMEFELYLEEANLNLDEVVVSATRWRQTSGNVPSKIIAIPAKEAALQNPQTAADLLGISGKVFIQKSQQGGGSPMIRGFATNRLLYTIDGVRMNSAIFRSGNIQNVINIDPFAVEGTEVLFGPGSVIYGSDAIGGVMSFQTLTPRLAVEDQPLVGGRAAARYSSANNERTGHFDVHAGWRKWAFVTSLSAWDYGHLRQGSNGPEDYINPSYIQRQDTTDIVIMQNDVLRQIPSAYSQVNLMQKVQFKPNHNWDFQYGLHHSETSSYGRYDRHNRVRDGRPRYAEWNYGPQSWTMHHLNVTHTVESAAFDQLTVRLAIQSFGESRISRDLNAVRREIRSEDVEAYSVNLDLVKSVTADHTLFYGMEYVLNDVNSTGINKDIVTGISSPGPSRYPQATWQSGALYISDELRISPRWTLQGGLRYSHFALDAEFDTTFYPFPFTTAKINNGSLTGSIGTVYRPTDMWVIQANFGTAFRSPNVDDAGKVFDSEPGTVVVPNPDLDAEYAYNFDLGVARVIGDVVKLDITGYYTQLQNALVRRNSQLNGLDSIVYDGVLSQVQTIQNAADANVYGIQTGLEARLPAGFRFVFDLNIQTGEEELDDGSVSTSRHAAPLFGAARLNFNTDKLKLQLYLMFQGERSHEDLAVSERGKTEIYALDQDGNTYAPSWHTINLKAMYQFDKGWTISSGLENITDQRYRPYSSGISGPGRNFVLSVTRSF